LLPLNVLMYLRQHSTSLSAWRLHSRAVVGLACDSCRRSHRGRHIGGLWTDTGWLLHAGSSVLSFVVIACLFAVIYKMLPEVRLTWRDVAVGALGTAALFTAGKYLIGAYPGSGRIGNSYGAAGSLLALLLWVYFSAQIFFLGAEFTRQYAIWFGSLRNAVGSAAGDTALPTRGSVHGDDA
jgi:uncharacterized BrkB/YihY/UPF0761 family membrane protein